jgi:hypothetical protein
MDELTINSSPGVSDRIRGQLLEEPDNRTLDEWLQIAATVEGAMAEGPALMTSSATALVPAQVNRIHSKTYSDLRQSLLYCGSCVECDHGSR